MVIVSIMDIMVMNIAPSLVSVNVMFMVMVMVNIINISTSRIKTLVMGATGAIIFTKKTFQ